MSAPTAVLEPLKGKPTSIYCTFLYQDHFRVAGLLRSNKFVKINATMVVLLIQLVSLCHPLEEYWRPLFFVTPKRGKGNGWWDWVAKQEIQSRYLLQRSFSQMRIDPQGLFSYFVSNRLVCHSIESAYSGIHDDIRMYIFVTLEKLWNSKRNGMSLWVRKTQTNSFELKEQTHAIQKSIGHQSKKCLKKSYPHCWIEFYRIMSKIFPHHRLKPYVLLSLRLSRSKSDKRSIQDLWKGHLKLSSLSLNPDTFNGNILQIYRFDWDTVRYEIWNCSGRARSYSERANLIRLTADRVFLLHTGTRTFQPYTFSSSQEKLARLKRLSKPSRARRKPRQNHQLERRFSFNASRPRFCPHSSFTSINFTYVTRMMVYPIRRHDSLVVWNLTRSWLQIEERRSDGENRSPPQIPTLQCSNTSSCNSSVVIGILMFIIPPLVSDHHFVLQPLMQR